MATNARRVLEGLVRQLNAREEAEHPIPEPSPPEEHRRLCVGMATYDDFDGVYFTVQAIRMFQPEVLDETTFVVIDNHPEGRVADDLKHFCDSVPQLRYVPFRGFRSTAVRDLIFREADADIVVCVDSHVILGHGSLRALLEFFDANPDSRDLIQGPLLSDDLATIVGTHFSPRWGAGMYGQWDTDELRVSAGKPFEIEMQGLGVFACRRDAWPGLNPRFRGFGGEEGYLHEKVRQSGGRVVCLPAMTWAHRFGRPHGTPYSVAWLDRIRNYYIGWSEIGWDSAPMQEHFRDHLGPEGAELVLSQAKYQVDNPFGFFDAIFCLNLDEETERWETMVERFKILDIGWRVERVPAIRAEHGCTHSFRSMVAEASRRGYDNVLIFEDDAVFLDQTLGVVKDAIEDLRDSPWDLLFLGGCVWAQSFPYRNGSRVLQCPKDMTCTHAVAINNSAFERFLDEIPEGEGPDFEGFIARYAAVDQYLAQRIGDGAYTAFVTSPRVASQPILLEGADADLALRDRYII